MIQTFNGMFAKGSSVASQVVVKALMNTRITKCSVRNHYLAMMSHLNRTKVTGAKLEEKMQIKLSWNLFKTTLANSK